MGILALGILLLALVGCGDDCDGIYDELNRVCHEWPRDDDEGPSEGPEKPGRLLAVDLETRDVIPVRDGIFGSGLVLDQPVAIELSPDRTIAYVADGARILSIRIEDGETRLISGADRGTGVLFDTPVGLEWNGASLVVHDAGYALAITVDVSSGNRGESLLPFSPESTEAERRIVDPAAGLEYIVFRAG